MVIFILFVLPVIGLIGLIAYGILRAKYRISRWWVALPISALIVSAAYYVLVATCMTI